MASAPEFVDASAVKDLIEKKEPGVVVVDVRDDDYFEAHIKGAVQVPSGQLNESSGVDKAIEELPTDTNLIVVHCMLSQVRGPKCARRLADRLQSEEWAGLSKKPEVKILRNGFEGFYSQFGQQSPELFEGTNTGSDAQIGEGGQSTDS